MARVKFYLDTRPTKDGKCHIKLSLSHNGTSALMPTGVFVKPEHWMPGDSETEPHVKKTCIGYKAFNSIITERFEAVQEHLNALVLDGTLNSLDTATYLKNYIQEQISGKTPEAGLVAAHFENFIERRNKPGTASVYRETLAKIAKYHDIGKLKFEDITVAWLKDFENKLRKDGLAVNSVARHLRDIRAVYNDAIDYNVVSLASYPFRRFKIKHERTRKRALSVEQLRQLRDFPCTESQRQYRDIFMLIFYLGGINLVDLFSLKEIDRGYIYYSRSKTNRPFQIKVEPEALEIINQYRGREHLLAHSDRYANHEDFTRRINRALQSIGAPNAEKPNTSKPGPSPVDKKKSTFTGLTTYWARHTLASLMSEIDIPKDTIAKVLGHADKSVTDIYIRFEQRKIDEAMRRVIDFVNGKENGGIFTEAAAEN